jgi:hypothetical protein
LEAIIEEQDFQNALPIVDGLDLVPQRIDSKHNLSSRVDPTRRREVYAASRCTISHSSLAFLLSSF